MEAMRCTYREGDERCIMTGVARAGARVLCDPHHDSVQSAREYARQRAINRERRMTRRASDATPAPRDLA